ncbi:hypothetical protein NDU88_003539 [Pleurodeles waltl]|uniref:Uncharacterized protein n=1 Tax=Pleurodeles waltl TaxID=8319 RepID=A0AAV7MBD1_PLEWA|nr:hypothetical protein NDU88_003539 [Pleurodeles waltl]
MHCSRGHLQPMFPLSEPGMDEAKEKIRMEIDEKQPEDEEEEPKASDLTVFASNCTLHGISHIFLPGGVTIRRAVWACAFLASLGCFLFQVADRIQYYSEFHHVTTLDEKESTVMTFPAITICNYNRFRKSAITKNDVLSVGKLLGLEKEESYSDYLQTLGLADDSSNSFGSKTFSMRDFFQRTGHSMEEMLLRCQYRNRDCGAENFTTVSSHVGPKD